MTNRAGNHILIYTPVNGSLLLKGSVLLSEGSCATVLELHVVGVDVLLLDREAQVYHLIVVGLDLIINTLIFKSVPSKFNFPFPIFFTLSGYFNKFSPYFKRM